MVLIPRWAAIVLFVLAIGSIVALGIAGYRLIGAPSGTDAAAIKARSEGFLYASIVAAAVLLGSLGILIGRTEYLTRELDKMVALNRYGDFSPEVSMKKFGRIGEKLTLLYFRLNALNEKRSLKISALSDLAQLLANNVDAPVVVSDITGDVVYANRRLAEKLGLHRSELLNANVSDFLEASSLQDVITQLDRSNTSLELSKEPTPVTAVPVNNRMNELSYIVWSFRKDGISTDGTDRPETRSRTTGMQGMIRRMFARNYGRRSES